MANVKNGIAVDTEGHVSAATAIEKSDITALGIPSEDTNTEYTFAGGTNSFTVTPTGGSAQTVTITPSITDNVTGSGTSGSLAKFNGANTVTDGPAFGSDTTKYLRNDGQWDTPAGAGTVTEVSAGVGLAGGPVTTIGEIKANLKSETASSLSSAAVSATQDREYAVHPDADGYLAVNVPWVNTTVDSFEEPTAEEYAQIFVDEEEQEEQP